jgi:NADH-quinone oxidoreductase subunit N
MIPVPQWDAAVWTLLGPLVVVCGTACLHLGLDLGRRERRLPSGWISLAGLALAAVLVLVRWQQPLVAAEQVLGGALRVDDFSVFLQFLVLAAAGLALVTADGYLDDAKRGQRSEFHALALFAVAGMMLLVTSGELMTTFLALELLSFPTYVLCAFRRDRIKPSEAALKYFVTGSFASSVFLYGVALVWGATGTTVVSALAAAPETALVHLGTLLLLAGFLFKIGAAPFHMWVPDVYEGAPIPVTTFMATAVKVAAFGAFVRLLVGGVLGQALPLAGVLAAIAILTMVVGNLSALTQENIKRLLAFSSVAHAGYMLVGLVAVAQSGWDTGVVALLYYLAAYVFMNVGAFTVVHLMSRRAEGDLQFDRDWSGAARRQPFLGVAMTVFMLGLGGIPPTAGFFGKYSLFKAAIDAGLVALVIVAVLNSLVSVYYYLRVVVAMYMRPERGVVPGVLETLAAGRTHALEGPGAMAAEPASVVDDAAVLEPPPPRLAEGRAWVARAVVLVCLVATLWLGFGPSAAGLPGVQRVLEWAEVAAASLR